MKQPRMNLRAALLPALAAMLVAGVLGVQVANGGGDFSPSRVADPCAERAVTSVSTGIDALGEQLVLVGLDRAACALHLTREALVIRLAMPGEPTDAEVDAVGAGLITAVETLDRQGRLPPVSDLADEALATAELPALVRTAIRLAPDRLIDSLLPTDDLLRRTVAELDLRRLLDELSDPAQVNELLRDAVTKAVHDAVLYRLRSALP